MSASKEKLTKYTAHYRCPDNIGKFKIRIKYRETNTDNVDVDSDGDWYSRILSWQEKRFSRSEKEFYGDFHNCVTDLERRYHEMVKEDEAIELSTIIFTYVEEDGYISEQEISCNKLTYLQSMVENINLNTEKNQSKQDDFDYNKSLLSSFENNIIQYHLQKMYIMVDLGEYVENIWIKNEQPLCIIKFDKNSKVLSIYPDFTTTQPYYIKIQGDTVRHFFYLIENCAEEVPEDIIEAEKQILQNITDYRISLLKRIVGDKFHLPPKNKLYVYLFFEILSAKNFEYSDIYVQYYIDLPEDWSCDNLELLKGLTQTGHGVNEEGLVHFGHCFDVVLEYNIQNLREKGIPTTPHIYFEVISKATWDRYRTEGLTYKSLPVSSPGCHFYSLSCFRFLPQGPSGNLRRFFIGDCSNYKDITWIGIPKEVKGSIVNKFGVNTVGTGQLDVRINILHQSQAFLDEFNERDSREKFIYEKLNSSSLIKSVEQVLKAFRRARRNMIEARKNL